MERLKHLPSFSGEKRAKPRHDGPGFRVEGCLDAWEKVELSFQARYNQKTLIGKGSGGKVYKAFNTSTKTWVAMKMIEPDLQQNGEASEAIRELGILTVMEHQNVVRILDAFCKPDKMVLVLEFIEYDLQKYMYRKYSGKCLEPWKVKHFALQLCRGVEYCHARCIVHRDLKPQNILIDYKLILKITDFGLARFVQGPIPHYTGNLVTLWYRPPEIILGQRSCYKPVDMWGVGCVIGEMAIGKPLFPGNSEIDTLYKIFQRLGTPTDATWPGVSQLQYYKHNFPVDCGFDLLSSTV